MRRWTAAKTAIDAILQAHKPYPAFAVDRHWNVVHVEFRPAPTLRGLFGGSHAPAGQRRAPHPASGGHGAEDRELWGVARPYAERASPADRRAGRSRFCRACSPRSRPIRRRPKANRRRASGRRSGWRRRFAIATRFGVMSFLGTVTVFGTPNDVTLSELALEMLFPGRRRDRADRARPWSRSRRRAA